MGLVHDAGALRAAERRHRSRWAWPELGTAAGSIRAQGSASDWAAQPTGEGDPVHASGRMAETEDIWGDIWGDGRHVAPPVIGEDPPDYHY
jgi:hypothetical protein